MSVKRGGTVHIVTTRAGISEFSLVYHYVKFNVSSVPAIFFYLNKEPEILEWLTAGISSVMLPAMLRISRHTWLAFHLLFTMLCFSIFCLLSKAAQWRNCSGARTAIVQFRGLNTNRC